MEINNQSINNNMKQLFSTYRSQQASDIAILITRVAVAALMLSHGLPKLSSLLSGDPVQFPGMFGMSPAVALGLTVFAEVICSVFILTGFATRLSVIPPIITMLVAVLMVHAADPFANKEPGLHFLVLYVVLLITGSGRYSVDHLLAGKKATIVSRNN